MIKNKIINHLQRVWYEINWQYILIGFRFYFRRWQIANYPKMSRLEPVIYVANHQNAFLDALAIIMSQKRHPLFLVRANIFATKIARFLLRSLNMFPIYRLIDGAALLSKNDQIIQNCIDMLIDGRQPLAIFVEGNHNMLRSLRGIKKGVGRIAFSALEQSDFKMNLKIIPIGINYSKHTKFRSDLLVNYGEPIMAKDYLNTYHENPNKAYTQLSKEISVRIKQLITNIESADNYAAIEKTWINERKINDNMLEELHHDKELIGRIAKDIEEGNAPKLMPAEKDRKSILSMIIGFPAFVYGTLNHLPMYFIISRIIGKVVTDIHFYGSIKLVGGMYIGTFMYAMQAMAVYALSGGNIFIALIYFVSLPFFGTFAYDHFLKYYTDEPHTSSSAELLKNYK